MKLSEIELGMIVWVPKIYSDGYESMIVIDKPQVLVNNRLLTYVKLGVDEGRGKYYTSRWARILRKEKP
jgi:hypothetical protein